MRGNIVRFSSRTETGFIAGTDGVEYEFDGSELQSPEHLELGSSVAFQPFEGMAIAIQPRRPASLSRRQIALSPLAERVFVILAQLTTAVFAMLLINILAYILVPSPYNSLSLILFPLVLLWVFRTRQTS